MRGVAVRSSRSRVLEAPAQAVWEWMLDSRELELFEANLFHRRASSEESALAIGSRIEIVHRLGLVTERRVARIAKLESFVIAWSEVRAQGTDRFPHYQQFTLEPIDAGSCELRNELRGTLHLPGVRLWLSWWYRRLLPRVLDLENRTIARAVASLHQRSLRSD